MPLIRLPLPLPLLPLLLLPLLLLLLLLLPPLLLLLLRRRQRLRKPLVRLEGQRRVERAGTALGALALVGEEREHGLGGRTPLRGHAGTLRDVGRLPRGRAQRLLVHGIGVHRAFRVGQGGLRRWRGAGRDSRAVVSVGTQGAGEAAAGPEPQQRRIFGARAGAG